MKEGPLGRSEVAVLGALRSADDPWVPLYVVARETGLGIGKASAGVRGLRTRGLVVKRPTGLRGGGVCSIEVSLPRSGIY